MGKEVSDGDEGILSIQSLLTVSNNILLLGHQNADPDAVCSMVSFSHLCMSINPNATIILVCDDVSRLANQVLKNLAPNIEILEEYHGDYDTVVLIDTNNKFQLGPRLAELLKDPKRSVVIDHHEHNPDVDQIAAHTIVRSDRSSTCEIIVGLYDEFDVQIDSTTANLLLTGIIFDTRRFFYADIETLSIALRLIQMGANYEACINSLIIIPDRSERIARLKAAGRIRIHDIDDWIIVTSKIKAFEASACRGLIDLGADVAIIGGKHGKSVVRLSARSTRRFHTETGVNLGSDIMEPLGKLIGGEGGGHANAAGANGTRNLDSALSKSVELIRESILKHQKKKNN